MAIGDLLQGFSNNIYTATGIRTPELGLTEAGGSTTAPNSPYNPTPVATYGFNPGGFSDIGSVFALPGAAAGQSSTSSTAAGRAGSGGGSISASDLAFLNDQEAQLRDLLNRTNTGLNQGLQQNEDEYGRQLGQAQAEKARQLANYDEQRIAQNQGKLNTYDTINKNANNGFRSLAQIIGRASGTGSSAFRDLLPNVIGTDTSAKRNAANQTYGSNLQGIDKAQSQYDISFADVLDDLLRQKKTNESTLRSGIESQRQNLNSQLGTVAGQRAQAQGGGYAQVRAAQQPFQNNINDSRNQVESFFNQFRTPFTARTAVAAAPELSQYTADRSVINAQNQGSLDPTNPYAALLRRRQEGTQ